VLINKVGKVSSSHGLLAPGDVVLAVDGASMVSIILLICFASLANSICFSITFFLIRHDFHRWPRLSRRTYGGQRWIRVISRPRTRAVRLVVFDQTQWGLHARVVLGTQAD
jgi:hypothetical protein